VGGGFFVFFVGNFGRCGLEIVRTRERGKKVVNRGFSKGKSKKASYLSFRR